VINRICGNDLWSGILGSGVLNDGNDEHWQLFCYLARMWFISSFMV
jgi:hypothetical protein